MALDLELRVRNDHLAPPRTSTYYISASPVASGPLSLPEEKTMNKCSSSTKNLALLRKDSR